MKMSGGQFDNQIDLESGSKAEEDSFDKQDKSAVHGF